MIKVDLDIEGCAETNELSVGGFIPIKADNDDGSAVTNGYAQTNDLAVSLYWSREFRQRNEA